MQDSSGEVNPQTTVLTREEVDRGSKGLVIGSRIHVVKTLGCTASGGEGINSIRALDNGGSDRLPPHIATLNAPP